MKVEITIDDTHAELVAGGFDAGIHIGEYIDRDMIAVRVSPVFSWIVVGAPGYFSRRGRPLTPEDLARHECIRFRRPDFGDVYRWEFERDGQALSIDPPGAVLVNDAAWCEPWRSRAWVAYTSSLQAGDEIAAGPARACSRFRLHRRATACSSISRAASRNQPKLRAFVEACARIAR